MKALAASCIRDKRNAWDTIALTADLESYEPRQPNQDGTVEKPFGYSGWFVQQMLCTESAFSLIRSACSECPGQIWCGGESIKRKSMTVVFDGVDENESREGK